MINREILSLKAKMENPQEVWLDFDDTVITVFGNQKSQKPTIIPDITAKGHIKSFGFIAEAGELLNAGLYGGKANSNNGFLDFFKETIFLVGSHTPVKGVHLDQVFFDEKNFIYFEDNCIEYVCKAKLTSNMHKIISFLNEQNSWREMDDTYSVAELTVSFPV